MKLSKQILFAVLVGLLGLAACKNTDFKKTKDGFAYKIFSNGKGQKIDTGNVIRYHRTDRLEDSLLGTSYGSPAQWMPIAKQGNEENQLATLMLQARKGDSILLITPIDSIIAKNPRAAQDSFIMSNKGKNLKTMFKVVEVYKDELTARAIYDKESVEERAKFEKESLAGFLKDPAIVRQKSIDEASIEAYLKSKNINTTRTPWGTYVQTLTPGNGTKAKPGQYAMLRYTGRLLTGQEFDSNNKPGGQLYPMQVGAGGSIKGFEDGVQQLSKGQKAILYVPSVVGYGTTGSQTDPQTGKQKIGPNQNLMFEIEVVDITDNPGAPTGR
ncbi:MAG TPA: FKBP-type peptidyl-prolyl cis-trans isomerase [Flavisolibacter sp.]|nr:FKBP-type peptidyl-prolyl cis-trans isomerase [Flavisolibacter sp.]